jgi:hypothetical protein
VGEVTPLGGRDARRSARFEAVGPDGQRLFAKPIPRERRDEDLLYRAWRRLVRRRAEPGRPGSGPPAQQVEHEAYLGLLAATAGVRTPRVVLAAPYGNGSGLLVQRMIPGHSLEELEPGRHHPPGPHRHDRRGAGRGPRPLGRAGPPGRHPDDRPAGGAAAAGRRGQAPIF